MKNKIYNLRRLIAGIVLVFAILGISGIFYFFKIYDLQFFPVFQRITEDFSTAGLAVFVFLILLTLIFGRIYCSTLCPFGIIQEIAGYFTKNKTKKPASYPLKYFVSAIFWGLFFGGTSYFIKFADPYTVFSSALSLNIAGIIVFLAAVILVLFKGRIFCSNFCPVGTVLGLISKISLNKIFMDENCVSCGLCEKNCPAGSINSKEKTVDNETCVKCLKCLSVCPKKSLQYKIKPKKEVKFNFQRRKAIVMSVAALVFLGMIKAGVKLKDTISEKIKDVILPPGAVSKERFLNKCLNCNLCVNNCPNQIIKKADDEFGAPHIDYSKNACGYDCNRCSAVCPAGALQRKTIEEKQKLRIAMAVISPDKCSGCSACFEVCPNHAITKEGKNIFVIDAKKCTGCGACKVACHFGAINLYGVREQKLLS